MVKGGPSPYSSQTFDLFQKKSPRCMAYLRSTGRMSLYEQLSQAEEASDTMHPVCWQIFLAPWWADQNATSRTVVILTLTTAVTLTITLTLTLTLIPTLTQTVIYTTKIDGVVCPPNISETVAGRFMKLAHRQRIASTTTKLIPKKMYCPF